MAMPPAPTPARKLRMPAKKIDTVTPHTGPRVSTGDGSASSKDRHTPERQTQASIPLWRMQKNTDKDSTRTSGMVM